MTSSGCLAGLIAARRAGIVPGGFAYFFRTGPFAWNGLLAFWIAAGAFFVWILVMTRLTLLSINEEALAA